jgi:hypothetical protein
MKEYPVGTLCLIVGYDFSPARLGKECTILASLGPVGAIKDDGKPIFLERAYAVDVCGESKSVAVRHEHLMKLDPPGEMNDDETQKDKERPRETADAL